MATTTATRNRIKIADRIDLSAPIVPHRYYPADFVAELVLMSPRAVTGVAEQVRETGKQSPSIPRPSWILAYTPAGKDKLRFRGIDILIWQDQVAGLSPSPGLAFVGDDKRTAARLPKRKPKERAGAAA
ncbi:MAG TPA: hypothetical protein DDX06_17270 [Curvibacter sp.]|nr:hypothetical protein [Curvibacter sp.]